MQVTRVHFLATEDHPCVQIDTRWGDDWNPIDLSDAMSKCLATDIQNRIADGHGHVCPTPWGWYWLNTPHPGRLDVPETSYHIHPFLQPLGYFSLPQDRIKNARR